jgi:predicted DNA-binding protein (MmcQ/YjbR family)
VTRKKLNAFCAALPQATHVVQWGDHDVYKIGGKVFAIIGGETGSVPTVTFKVTPIAYEILRDAKGCRPTPYLASRGMTWIQAYDEPGLNEKELREYIAQSHTLVASGLSKKLRKELGLG